MSNTIEFQGARELQAHSQKPLDETVWRAWLGKNLLQERQRAAARIKALKWACIGVLMVSAVASSYIFTPYVSAYQAVVRFAIGLGAIVIMFESLRARQYAFTALFAAVVLLFNPVVPTFAFAGNWVILFAGVLPFLASLVWMKERTRRAAVTAGPAPVLGLAAEVIQKQPAAIQFRYLQTLVEIGSEKNTTVVFPLPIEMFANVGASA